MDINKFLSETPWGGMKWTLALERRLKDEKYLEAYGYKVYSQNDEDGIIQEIFCRIGTTTKSFIEFGVQNGLESNGHSLLLQGWNGVWIDCDNNACQQIFRRFAPAINQGKLQVLNRNLNRDNINEMLNPLFDSEVDLLSIDVDGNDWHIWNAIHMKPRVVMIEYNGTFAPEIDWKMPYNEYHVWDETDYFGVSLKALEILGTQKGYQLVGTNISGVNAFFVRKELCEDKFPLPATAENLYNPLRLNMVPHRIGHRSKNFVGNDLEGMAGLFQYYPDWNSLASFGFYPVQIIKGIRRNLMKEKDARLFIRFIPENVSKIRLYYESASCIECLSNIEMMVTIGSESEYTCKLSANEGYVDIPITGPYNINDVIPLDIHLNQLWVPSMVNDGIDCRTQGICVTEITYI